MNKVLKKMDKNILKMWKASKKKNWFTILTRKDNKFMVEGKTDWHRAVEIGLAMRDYIKSYPLTDVCMSMVTVQPQTALAETQI